MLSSSSLLRLCPRAACAWLRSAALSTSSSNAANETTKRMDFNLRGYNRYGLYQNDTYRETDEVIEALRRLPPRLQDERNFRLARALQADVCRTILPKEEWTTFEDDLANGRYLDPYLDEVFAEIAEQKEWDSQV